MTNKYWLIGLCLVAPTFLPSFSQTQNVIPKFSNGSTLVNSSITELNGNAVIDEPVAIHEGDLAITPSISTASGGSSTLHLNAVGGSADSGYSSIQSFYAGVGYSSPLVLQNLGGKVGIGLTNPLSLLDVNGAISIKGVPVVDRTTISTPSDGTYVIASNNRVDGEYILNWESAYREQTIHLIATSNQFDGGTIQILANHSYTGNTVLSNFRLLLSSDRETVYLVMDVGDRNGGTSVNVQHQGSARFPANFGGTLAGNESSTGAVGFVVNEAKVGIGTLLPTAALDVAGNIKISGSGASLAFPDGTTQSTAWNGTLCGGDYAESVDVSGERTQYEPGDVLVVDPRNPARFLKSSEPYSMSVSGVYSTKPGLVGRRQTADPKKSTSEIPMAMVGIVPTKVSAENGPIHPGDILVTSSTLGHAMKGTDRGQFAGAIVGKALGSIESGIGLIEALITLQ